MKKLIWMIVVVIVIIGAVLYRGSGNKSSNFTIGVVAPLSGDYAQFGEKIRGGMEIARQDLAAEGKQITIKYEDGCLPKDAVAAVTKLVTVDKVDLIGGSFCLIGLIPSLPILEQNNVIVFNTAANPDSILNTKSVVSTNFSIKDDAVKIGDYVSKTLGAKKIAIVYYDNDFGKTYQSHIHETIVENGSSVVFEQGTPSDAKDFKTVLTKLKSTNPDAIALVEIGPSLAIFLKQAKELGVTVPIVGYYENEDPSLLTTAGAAAEGLIISSADAVEQSPALNDFAAKYKAAYKTEPDTLSLNAYDALHIQVMALEKCGKKYECLIETFKSVKDYKGLSGTITIQQDGSAYKPTVFKKVEGGKFVKIPY